MKRAPAPTPTEYLRDLSIGSTQAFMLKRLEMAAAIRKDLREHMEKLVQALVDAEIASLILEGKLEFPEKPQVIEGKSDAA